MSLKSKAFSSVRWTSLGSGAGTIVRFVQVAVLARLLEPEDYGLMAIVTAILGFLSLFADCGVNIAYVQRQEVSEEQRSSLFWFNVSVGAGLTVLLMAASPLLARLFADQRLTNLIMLSASTFLFTSLGAQVKLNAEKMLNFKPVIIVEITALVIGMIVGVALACLGWGVYALIYAALSSALFSSLFFWMFLAKGWRPIWRMKLVDLQPFMRFAFGVIIDNFISQLHTRLDIFLGGRLLGADGLGLYSVPRNLMMQVQMTVNPIVTRVGFPLIAQAQNDIPRMRTIYKKTLNMTSSINAPIYLGVFLFGSEITAILLGPRWQEAGKLLSALALWGAVRSIANPVGSLLMGAGRVGLAARWNLALLLIVPVFYWVGSLQGPKGLAWAMFVISVLLFVPTWYFLVRPISHMKLAEYVTTALRPFVLAGVSYAASYLLARQFEMLFLRLGVGVSIALPVYILLSLRFNREWTSAMIEMLGRVPKSTKTVETKLSL